MRRTLTLTALAGAAATIASLCLPAVAGADGFGSGGDQGGGFAHPSVVYVQTNDPTGNQVVTYLSDGGGSTKSAGPIPGASVWPSRVRPSTSWRRRVDSPPTRRRDCSSGVNGGSNTISVFHAFGPYVGRPRVVASGGTTPVSVAVRGDLIYVLNAGGTGSIQGFYADSLTPIPGSNRTLGLTPGLTPAFLNTPGQIGFTPDGRHLVVTTKANGSDIDVFAVTPSGSVAGPPVVNPSATPVPFGFTFDRAGHLVVTEAATSALTTYAIAPGGTLTELGSTADGLAALCWVTTNGTFFFGANAGSATVTSYTIGANGVPTIVASTSTDPGPIDLVASPDGHSLFVETGANDVVDSFAVQADGSLVATGSASPELPGHNGLEGIAVGSSF